MSNTGSAGTYGSASRVPVFNTDTQGRVTSVTNTSIQISESQVTNLVSDLGNITGSINSLSSSLASQKADKIITISAGTGLTGGGDLSTNRTISLGNTGSAGTYGSATTIPVFNTDAQGRVTSATNTSASLDASQITTGILSVARGGTGLGTSPTNGQLLIGNGTGFTENTINSGTGIIITNGAGSITASINNSVVATISGSTFTGTVKFNAGLSGSLTKLTDGSSYIIASNNVSVTSASNGAITLKATPSGSDTQVQFNDGGTTFGANSGLTYNKTTQALTGTIIRSTLGFSGSHTTLSNGTSAFVQGTGILVTSSSNGPVTITMSNTGSAGTYGSASQVPVFSTDAQGRVTSANNTSIAIDGSQVVSGNISVPIVPLRLGSSGIQSITSSTNQITPTGTYHRITNTTEDNITLSNAQASINWPGATVGQVLIVQMVVVPGLKNVVLTRGATTKLALAAATVTLSPGASATFIYDGSLWVETAFTGGTSAP
jgi:hypothetical protein